MRKVTQAQREVLELVTRAAFENPFGAERDRLDERISGTRSSDPLLLARLVGRVTATLDQLDKGGAVRVDQLGDEDKDLVEHAVLFDAFHRYVDALDEHIEKQLDAGQKPVSVGFAKDLLSLLASRGIPAERAERMLALFYQMRRGYFFVARGLVGRSASMRRLRESLWNAIFTQDIRVYDRYLWDRMEDFSTILLGETGTGKGAAAAAIGRSGYIPYDGRRGTFEFSFAGSFVPVNISEFPESLIEAELFGHRKGAFTGAVDDREGVFDGCREHGAIFIDEIGEVSAPVQVKLLRVLQDRTYTPVGGREPRRFAGRVIAATHRPLETLRGEGHMRDDFYYRLCSQAIHVPPLRTRLAEEPGELDDLLDSLLPRLVGEPSVELRALVHEAIDRDLGPDYAWPGNVRELEQCIRRVLLTRKCAPDPTRDPATATGLSAELDAGMLTAEQLVARYCAHLYARHGTYVEVARITGLDRRTVKKHVEDAGT
jgi:DNA-binding NtrC family response regulator